MSRVYRAPRAEPVLKIYTYPSRIIIQDFECFGALLVLQRLYASYLVFVCESNALFEYDRRPISDMLRGAVEKSDHVRTLESSMPAAVRAIEELDTRSMSLYARPGTLPVPDGSHVSGKASRECRSPAETLLVARAREAAGPRRGRRTWANEHTVPLVQRRGAQRAP